MAFHLLALTLSAILSISDYVTEQIFSKKVMNSKKFVSFAAGAAIAYLILHSFPDVASYALIDGNEIFIYALLGFVSLNLIEQFLYKSVGKLKNISLYHKRLHVAYFFLYNLIIGAVLVVLASSGLKQTLIFFIPFLLYIIAEILPEEFAFKKTSSKIFYSLAPLFGTIIAITYISFINSIFTRLMSFVTGTLLYIVIRESLPSDQAERPLYFIVGVLFYTLILLMSWNTL